MLAQYEINRERDENIFIASECDNVCPIHFHRKVEVMYVLSGEKKICAAGKEVTLFPDQIYFANSYEMHGYEESEGGRQTVIVFPNHMLHDYYAVFGDKLMKGCIIRDGEFCRSLLPDIRAIVDGADNKLLLQAHCDMLLGSIADKLGWEEGARSRQTFVDALIAYIGEHYAEEITLESMAEHFGYSRYYFSRMFNLALGTSITDYVSAVRLMHALDLMKNTGCTASEAALESGFNSIPTFYRVLKKNYSYKAAKDLL